MIQRIQTIFLLLAAACIFLLFAFPFASTPADIPNTAFADQVFDINDQIIMLVLFVLAGALAVISIFLFRNRKLQMRLTLLSFFLNLAGIIVSVIFYAQALKTIDNQQDKDELGRFLPLAALVFAIVAYRFIRKDEKLVKSMDRLR
ncbi:MAG: DUF4293 domain-containing protein [Saprospiraceae bacterium]|nr:DUF4293 domain-containing protein [Saprospiraceae bacterium]